MIALFTDTYPLPSHGVRYDLCRGGTCSAPDDISEPKPVNEWDYHNQKVEGNELYGYWGFLLAMLVCLLISGYASGKVRSAYAKYDQVRCSSGMTGHTAAIRILQANQVSGISVGKVGGLLTDHYHPTKNVVNLSESTYNSASIAAVAVAAHEIGHVLQHKKGYLPYRVRTAIVPAVNFGSRLAMPLVLIGILLETSVAVAGRSNLGYSLAMTGVLLYGLSVLFALVTLPVEYNASRRAKEMLLSKGILTTDELPGAEAVLSAAAMTYLASLLVSILSFFRFIFFVMSAFGRRNNRRY